MEDRPFPDADMPEGKHEQEQEQKQAEEVSLLANEFKDHEIVQTGSQKKEAETSVESEKQETRAQQLNVDDDQANLFKAVQEQTDSSEEEPSDESEVEMPLEGQEESINKAEKPAQKLNNAKKLELKSTDSATSKSNLNILQPIRPMCVPLRRAWFTVGARSLKKASGKWYFEWCLGCGVEEPQLGWLTDQFKEGSRNSQGVGDDKHGWAADGINHRLWHGGQEKVAKWQACWQEGDVIGAAIDLDAGKMQFSLNGEWVHAASFTFKADGRSFYPAVSSQGDFTFSFAKESFKFSPPNDTYQALIVAQDGARGVFARPQNVLEEISSSYVPSLYNFTIGARSLKKTSGKWYCEWSIIRYSGMGHIRLGWLTDHFKEGGVGDDEHGWAADGFTHKLWHCGREKEACWPTSLGYGVIGAAIDIDAGKMQFSFNGEWVLAASFTFEANGRSFYPAISLNDHYYDEFWPDFTFSFAKESFKFSPPDSTYQAFIVTSDGAHGVHGWDGWSY